MAAQFLRWQDPVSAVTALLHFFALGVRKFVVNPQTPLSTH
jgi:hypothetical protein